MIELLVLHEEGIMSMDRVDDSETHVRAQRTQCLIGRFGTVMGEEEVAIDGDQMNARADACKRPYLLADPDGRSQVCHHMVGRELEAACQGIAMVEKPTLDVVLP